MSKKMIPSPLLEKTNINGKRSGDEDASGRKKRRTVRLNLTLSLGNNKHYSEFSFPALLDYVKVSFNVS